MQVQIQLHFLKQIVSKTKLVKAASYPNVASKITLQCMALHWLYQIMGDTPYRIVTIAERIKPKQRPPRQNAHLDNIYAWPACHYLPQSLLTLPDKHVM